MRVGGNATVSFQEVAKTIFVDFGISSGISRYRCEDCDFDVCDLCVAEYLNPSNSSMEIMQHSGEEAPSESEGVPVVGDQLLSEEAVAEANSPQDASLAAPIEVEIPMSRIRWMWESEEGWQVYIQRIGASCSRW